MSDVGSLRPRPHPLLTGAAAAAMWATMFAVVARRGDLLWNRALWSGVIATGFLVGAAAGAAVRWLRTTP